MSFFRTILSLGSNIEVKARAKNSEGWGLLSDTSTDVLLVQDVP